MLYLVLCNILRTISQPQISAVICITGHLWTQNIRKHLYLQPSGNRNICNIHKCRCFVADTDALRNSEVTDGKPHIQGFVASWGVKMHWNYICDFGNRPIYPRYLLYLSAIHKHRLASVSVTSADPKHLQTSVSANIRGPEHPVLSVSAYFWTTKHLDHLYRAIYICVKL